MDRDTNPSTVPDLDLAGARVMVSGALPNDRDPRLAALSLANTVRRARAELKRQVATGAASAGDVLVNPPSIAATWPLSKLLMSQRGWGKAKCRRFLAVNKISEARLIGELTVRQRQLLAMQMGLVATNAQRRRS